MNINPPSAQDMLDKAIQLALSSSWETLTLVELAKEIGCPLTDVRGHFRSKDELAELLFDNIDNSVLQLADNQDYLKLSTQQKTINCIFSWFKALTPVKPLIKEIMLYKLEPGHFHLQAHGITRVSRTVQWFREISGRPHTGLAKVADEIAVTSVYLTSFSFYLLDSSQEHIKTAELLESLISKIDKVHSSFSQNCAFSKSNSPFTNKS